MAKKDAIFDYSSNFDSSGYTTGMLADWNANQARTYTDRFEIMWSGDPTQAAGAEIAGWEAGCMKGIDLGSIALDDTLNPNEEGFQSMSHKLVYDIKRAFNLPNQENLATWKDEYTTAAGEHHLFVYLSKDMASWPMALATDGFTLDGTNNTKCALEIGISGFDDYGVSGQDMQYTVRPTATNVSTYNAHYQTLRDNNTAAADYTSPTQVGSQFSQIGNVLLINYENQWQPTNIGSHTKDQIKLIIAWSSHSYAQIKALIDAAIA